MSRISDLLVLLPHFNNSRFERWCYCCHRRISGDGSGLTGVASTDNIQTATDAKFLANVNITGITTATGGFVGDLTR